LNRMAGRCAIVHQIAEHKQPVIGLVNRIERVNVGMNIGENQVSHKLRICSLVPGGDCRLSALQAPSR